MSRFGTLLVANRGEIAIRVLRTAAARGLRTVAVYSDADREAPHVREADAAVRIGPAAARASYLDVDALLDAAKRSGADAVHPGYGFLSEHAPFARAVAAAGLVFIGPPADVMEVMGRKDHAREIAVRAGVPVLPIFDLSVRDGAITLSGADKSVFPVLVKAAAGGGGKGIRIVRTPAELPAAVDAAGREAMAAFGDGTLLVERYVESGRHIEVQVFADEHGNAVHLFERDCSVQRRHQKVIEEAPAPTISDASRRLVTESALALCRAVGYVNAGTVEFLATEDDAYFLEMNTRLQVEHPVTEAVTGIDLVGWQLDVAQGLPLPRKQAEITLRGHAIEARVYAEDAFAGFLPQAGIASVVRWPARARVDQALEPGQLVGTNYDPMLGKVIATGQTREAARQSLVSALDESAILGLTTNLGFLRQLAASAAYRDAVVDTSWLDSHPDVFVLTTPTVAWAIAAWALAHPSVVVPPLGPFAAADGWRLAGPPADVPVMLTSGGATKTLHVNPAGESISSESGSVRVRSVGIREGVLRLELDGEVHDAVVEVTGHEVLVAYQGQTYVFERPDAFRPVPMSHPSDGMVKAPMPGTILAVNVAVGDRVAEGAALGALEAMKMELMLKAPLAGTVAVVGASTGEQVALGHPLFVIEPTDADGMETP